MGRVVSGSVTYRQRVALVPGSVVEVSVTDASCQDAPAAVLGTARVEVAGRQVPIPFEVVVAADAIDARAAYAVSARILGPDGQPLFVTPEARPVPTRGAPDRRELVLVPVRGRGRVS